MTAHVVAGGYAGKICVQALFVSIALNACKAREAEQAARLPNPCDAPIRVGEMVRLEGPSNAGLIRDALELTSSVVVGRVLAIADSGLYLAHVENGALRLDRRLIGAQEAPSVDAVTEDAGGRVTMLDRRMQRVVTFGAVAGLKEVRELPRNSTGDEYVTGGGHIAAITATIGDRPYARVEGQVRALDSADYPSDVLARFPSLARRVRAMPIDQKLQPRPLEIQPIVRWSPWAKWVIASTDTLNIVFGAASGTRSVHASGERVRITAALVDSGVDAYVASRGATGTARAAGAQQFARTKLFANRPYLQLIDDVIVLADSQFAVRRMHLCEDRQGWNIISRNGRIGSSFTVPTRYTALEPTSSGLLFVERDAGVVVFWNVPTMATAGAVSRAAH